ncbi:MAG TPA: N-acetylmuramoyl-L-alanine amidase [Brevundimonas sp.]|jgi:N-acetylmuramoyl-L-alanine amidase
MSLIFEDAPSPNFDVRRGLPDMLVLHYTGMASGEAALARLRDPSAKVSAHYLVEEDGRIFALVPEERRAWHAGRGVWQGETDINTASIGIEIVNPGHEFGYRAFPDAQIEAVIALTADIRSRWCITDARIIAHSDMAPKRKHDPGELFPWKRLAQAGHGLWFEPALERIAALGGFLQVGDEGIGVVVLRAGLHRLGYGLQPGSTYDDETAMTVKAFQRHWRQHRVDGVADGETRATLMGVLQLATAESVTGVLN